MTVVTRNFAIVALLVVAGCGAISLAESPAQATSEGHLLKSKPSEGGPAEELFLRLGKVGLHSDRVYHVRDAHIDRPGFYLTLEDGTIGFTEDVEGRVTGALFSGAGEILALPPDRAERSSPLATS